MPRFAFLLENFGMSTVGAVTDELDDEDHGLDGSRVLNARLSEDGIL